MSAPVSGRDFALPDLGEGLTEAELVEWRVAVGDTVTVDQPVAEVETAKAAVEVPCPFAGTVTALHAEPGQTVPVGAPLVTVAAGGAGGTAEPAAADTADSGRSSAAEPSDHQAFTEPGTVVPEARTSPETGPHGNGAAQQGQGSGAVLVGYGTGAGRPRRGRRRKGTTASPAAAPPSGPEPRAGRVPPVVSPLVRRLARENGVDVAHLAGSGEGGLVLRRDVEAAIRARRGSGAAGTAGVAAAAGATSTADAAAGSPVADGAHGNGGPTGVAGTASGPRGPEERIPMRGARAAMAERLSRSRREIPEATVWVDVDASGLVGLRSRLNAAAPDRPVSLLGLLARFCTLGLQRFPDLNSRVDTERGELVRFSRINLGVAAQTPRGLVVPVVRDTGAMNAREVSAAIADTARTARDGGLSPEDMAGGTFTVNNYGVFGVDGSAAIINHPEAAILGMGRIIDRPWVVDGELSVRPVTELTLAFDHRVCDGGTAGGFLRFVADCVESPELLLGEL
ncbi:dihydrolipoamide acetyltransferase family protein [Nocardiopsis sp. RSe5-2]|uniref:Dihydrolipoamide acetyltransferase component of pyruvate dehydrogenase complex n=1 Tax=Nocardiopsis endophytica TaxID=3018445 RepID=A0ABT4U6V2_9ACTN|nr:dihydrolipoamide acetyltransferase family protein [Nocardiopsis endophytica]MDA2812678.1 dihydrolipoamide acetyltransferase family protein [Nocardiopsis endophytica]